MTINPPFISDDNLRERNGRGVYTLGDGSETLGILFFEERHA